MAMSDFWGKAHTNNNIGYGNSGVNNFGFGSVYDKSESGATDLLPNISPSATFKERVENDLGTFEAQQCLDAEIETGIFDNALLVVTPNGYKEGKLYSFKPSDGNGDFNVVRNTNATRVNENGLIESVANNIARLDYLNASCPSLLIEPQATNLIGSNNLSSPQITNECTSTLTSGVLNPFGVDEKVFLIQDNTVNSEHRILIDSAPADDNIYTRSVFVKKNNQRYVVISASVGFSLFSAIFDFDTEAFTYVDSNITASFLSLSNGWYRISISRQSTGAVDRRFQLGFSSDGTVSGTTYTGGGNSFYAFGSQLEVDDLTSFIPTNGSAVTRNADAATVTPPIGTTEIIETFEDGSTNIITSIPSTYQISNGRFKHIIFN